MSAPTTFNCAATAGLPFSGAEILVLSLVFLMVIVCFCVTFIDVAIKQMWPQKFLDPAVLARVQQIQALFPNLGQSGATTQSTNADAASVVVKPLDKTTPVPYTKVVCPAPYIAGRAVDDDLVYILANNSCFSTVSSYCSSTVRGYNVLSTTLMTAGMCLGYLWTHNAMVDPSAGQIEGKIALLGYVLVFLTGIVMCGPNGQAVYRNANIALFSNLPLQWCGKANPLLHLHELGIGGFVLLPFLAHAYRALTEGSTMPNYTAALTGCAWQLIGALLFGACTWLGGKVSWFPKLLANQCAIIAEIIAVFASFLAYLQWEFYGTAACANYVQGFQNLLLAAAALPFGLCVRHYCFAPTSFPTAPSLLLVNGDTPTAIYGPCTAMSYDQQDSDLPVLPAA